MPRFSYKFFDEETRVLEIGKRQTLHAFKEARQIIGTTTKLQANAATPRRALQHHRIADFGRPLLRILKIADQWRTRQ